MNLKDKIMLKHFNKPLDNVNMIENAIDECSIAFGTWYSGMEKEKVAKAYERYLKETNKW
jgi:hypothetical protein